MDGEVNNPTVRITHNTNETHRIEHNTRQHRRTQTDITDAGDRHKEGEAKRRE